MGSGDPMFVRHMRLAALSASALGALALAGCSAGDGVDTTPPAARDNAAAQTAPDLMGAPPAPDAATAPDGLLGAPMAGPAPVTVAPVAGTNKPSTLKTWRRPDGTLVTAMRPIPNPKERRAVRYAPRAASAPAYRAAAPVAKPAAKPYVVAAAPPPKMVVPTPALKPVAPPAVAAPLAKAPTPAIVAAAPAAKPMTKLDKLQAAVAPEATKGAVLATGESLGKGEAGQVTLSLPATLGDMIKAQAAKLGLGKAAKKASAYANLEGEGYEVTPNGRQTAVIKPGEPTTFAWQVKPGTEAKGQLKSDFGVDLNGVKPAQSFSLGEIVKRVAPLQEQAKVKTDGLLSKLNLPGLDGKVSLPGIGTVPMKAVLGGLLVLLAVIILAIISRSASNSRAQAERRRKFRTLTDYGRNEMELADDAPTTAHVAHVSPMVAAAGGALAATAVSHAADAHGHDDHAHDAHGHAAEADHGHEDHGHDAVAHDDHGHAAAESHAVAHPEPHAPAEHVAYVNPMVAAASHAPAHDDHGHDDHGHETPAVDHGHDAHAADHPAPAADHAHDPHHGKVLEPAH